MIISRNLIFFNVFSQPYYNLPTPYCISKAFIGSLFVLFTCRNELLRHFNQSKWDLGLEFCPQYPECQKRKVTLVTS